MGSVTQGSTQDEAQQQPDQPALTKQEKHRAYRQWVAQNRERRRQSQKLWYQKHKARELTKHRVYYTDHQEHERERSRAYYQHHRAAVRAPAALLPTLETGQAQRTP
jgi:hypothetical protein